MRALAIVLLVNGCSSPAVVGTVQGNSIRATHAYFGDVSDWRSVPAQTTSLLLIGDYDKLCPLTVGSGVQTALEIQLWTDRNASDATVSAAGSFGDGEQAMASGVDVAQLTYNRFDTSADGSNSTDTI